MKRQTYLFFIPVFLIQCLFFGISFRNTNENLLFFFLGLLMLFTLIKLYSLLLKTLDAAKTVTELMILEQEKQLEEEQTLTLKERHKETEAIQQKIKDSLNIFQLHLDHKDYHTAQNYLKEFTDSFQHERFRPCCQDNLLNAILDAKRKTAEKSNIEVYYEILLPSKCEIPSADLSSIFFNLLDNGIESCINSGLSHPNLHLSTSIQADYLSIHMKNSKNPAEVFHHVTNKKDSFSHGFGLSIIEEITKTYHGMYEWQDQGDTFDSVVLLKI